MKFNPTFFLYAQFKRGKNPNHFSKVNAADYQRYENGGCIKVA
jgi:hypothetical protein